MANFVASQEAAKWLVATLTANGTIAAAFGTGGAAKIYAGLAPPNVPGHVIVFQHQAPARDMYAAGRPGLSTNFRVATTCYVVVKVIGQTEDWGDLEAEYAAVDAALDNQSGSTAVARVSCSRQTEIQLVESDGPGPQWRHLGGLYTLLVSAL